MRRLTTDELIELGPAGWTAYGWLYGFAPRSLFLELLRMSR